MTLTIPLALTVAALVGALAALELTLFISGLIRVALSLLALSGAVAHIVALALTTVLAALPFTTALALTLTALTLLTLIPIVAIRHFWFLP